MSKKLTPEEAESKIREAAEDGRITYAETDDIDQYEEIAREFLTEILEVDYDGCFISDMSQLNDFSSCGMNNVEVPEELTLTELYRMWDQFIVKKIEARYGIVVEPKDLLVDVFEQIRRAAARTVS